MKKLFQILIVLSFLSTVNADEGFLREINIGVGMVNNSIVENDNGIKTTDTTIVVSEENTSEALPVSNISMLLNWSFALSKKSSWNYTVTAPLTSSVGTSFFMTGLSYRRFIYSMSSAYRFMQRGVNFNILPNMRYFIGANVGAGYLTYNTLSAKKSDASLNLGLEAGLMWQYNPKYAAELNLSFVKRTGILTSGIGMNFFVGVGIRI